MSITINNPSGGAGGSGATNLDELTDVAITSATEGDILQRDASNFKNVPFAEAVDDRVNALIVAGTNITKTYDDTTNTLTIAATGGAGVSDGDKGDITVSGSGATWTIDNDAVTYAKIQNVSATDKLLGRSTAGAGDIEEIICTAAGRALLDDANAAAQLTTLGAAAASHTHEADDIVSGVIGPTFLGTGTSISTKYLRGDGTWQTLGAGVTDLDGLSDVAITTPANKHALIHNGTSFVNRALVVADISDLVEASTCQIKVIDDATTLTTGDGKFIFAIPSELNGYNLTAAIAFVTTVSSSGTPTIQIRNVTQAADMLTTRITIDANENTSSTAAAAVVIDTANDDVAAYDLIAIDVDVAGTDAKGLGLILTFTKA